MKITPRTMKARWRLRMKIACFLSVAVSFGGIAHAQNSSLFQRPISYASARPAPNTSQETLPSPTREYGNTATGTNLSNNNSSAPMTMQGMDSSAGFSPLNQGQSVPQGMPYGVPLAGPSSLMGLQSSYAYIPPTPTRTLKLHDIVSIRVDEASTSLALGNATSRKSTSYDAVLRDWIRLVGIDTMKPAPQSDGDPRVQAIQNEVYRGDSTLRTNESMTTNIAAEIVDIRPNGLIVLSGTKTIIQNDNTFQFSLTGTCRSQDILPDNTILSRNLINATINKQDQGHVRDGYSRGWLTKFLARIKPF
jgi:flagellar L-ring protein precursor FlgH